MKKIILASAFALLSTSVFAHPNTGCGLGSVMIQDQSSLLMQLFAVTTNGTSGNQTFAISSGTSGCQSPSKIVSNGELNTFVASNMDGLAIDIANGHGEVVSTVAAMLQVQDVAAFIAQLQQNFDAIYTSETVNSAHVIDNIISIAG